MKKIISILLCLVMVFGLAESAFAANSKTITGKYSFSPSADFLGDGDARHSFSYSDDYFRHSGYEYDHELAKMSMDLALASYPSTEVPGWDITNFEDLMTKCEFKNISANYYATHTPTSDSIGVEMASKKIDGYTLIAVAVRGHNYNAEWASNLTIGKTGDHEGFAYSRDQVLAFIREYIATYKISGSIKLWITGYSRGAIVANLVGGAVDQGFYFGKYVYFDRTNLYCYTFESPQGTADKYCRSELYYNIHNIINPNDIVTVVTPSEWGHSRYGIDYRLPCRQLDALTYYSLKGTVDLTLRSSDHMTIGYIPLDLIDSFRYVSEDPLSSLLKKNITQIEFYDELMDVITDKVVPSREYYVKNLQSDLRAFSASVLSGPDALTEILQCFGKKFLSLKTLTELRYAINLGNRDNYGKAIEIIENKLVEAMEEAGYYHDDDQTRAAVHNITLHFFKLYQADPDLTITLFTNIVPIINAHFPEIGRAWLDATPAEFFIKQGKTEEQAETEIKTDPKEEDADSYAVIVNSPKNGEISVDKKTAYEGSLVTLTVTPAKGFTLESVTVLDKYSREIKLTSLKNNKYRFTMPGSKVSVNASFMDDNAMLNFCVDVKSTDYFYEAVLWAYENDICNGTDALHFSPYDTVTRAQVVTFLWRAAGCPKVNQAMYMSDVPSGAYYTEAVRWALAKGITKGITETSFGPNQVCTRAQIVTFLARFAGVKDMSTASSFMDVNESDYFAAAVKWAKDNGVTEGVTSSRFSPYQNCTRAEVVTFIWRWITK